MDTNKDKMQQLNQAHFELATEQTIIANHAKRQEQQYEELQILKEQHKAANPSHPTLEQIIAAIPTFNQEERKTIARHAIEGL